MVSYIASATFIYATPQQQATTSNPCTATQRRTGINAHVLRGEEGDYSVYVPGVGILGSVGRYFFTLVKFVVYNSSILSSVMNLSHILVLLVDLKVCF